MRVRARLRAWHRNELHQVGRLGNAEEKEEGSGNSRVDARENAQKTYNGSSERVFGNVRMILRVTSKRITPFKDLSGYAH